MNTPKPMTLFWLVKTTSEWLQLPPLGDDGRFDFVEKTLKPILKKHPHVALRFFDAEAYSSTYTDVMMWTVTDINEYNAMVEELRETPFWDRYFEIRQIVLTFENQYADHYKQAPVTASAAA